MDSKAYYRDYLTETRRWFHQHPELSEKEFETSRRVKAELDRMGIPWRPCGLETGVLAEIRGAKPGRTILLRADMDALPVQEETGLPYASENAGVMHACGHDCHIAMLLTAARILMDRREELCGTVRLAFQPSEEIGTGGKSMIAQGAMDGVDGFFAIHVWSDIPSGKISLEPGPRMASADRFIIDITGKSAHCASPHQGIDAVVAASAMVGSLQSIVSREIAPGRSAVVTVGSISAGTCWNVIAEQGRLEGTVRCFDPETRKLCEESIRRIVDAAAATYRAKAALHWMPIVPPCINDPDMSALVAESAGKLMPAGAFTTFEKVNTAEDCACYMEKAPGVLALLGIRNDACGAVWPQHSNKFQADEDALLTGAMLHVQTAMDFNAR